MDTANNSRSVIRRILIAFLIFLGVMHIVSVIVTNNAHGTLLSLAPKFDLDNEFNVPTVYAGILWGVVAFLGVTLACQAKRRIEQAVWVLLSVFFFYLSFDEQMMIHEGFAAPIRSFLSIPQDSIFYHAWVIPAIAITAGLGVCYIAIKNISRTTKNQKQILKYTLILGCGVVFFEAIGTLVYVSPMAYKLGPVLFEELFELSMASFILYKLYGMSALAKS